MSYKFFESRLSNRIQRQLKAKKTVKRNSPYRFSKSSSHATGYAVSDSPDINEQVEVDKRMYADQLKFWITRYDTLIAKYKYAFASPRVKRWLKDIEEKRKMLCAEYKRVTGKTFGERGELVGVAARSKGTPGQPGGPE